MLKEKERDQVDKNIYIKNCFSSLISTKFEELNQTILKLLKKYEEREKKIICEFV